ncbi:MAG: hypothetical protein RLY71_364 [Pseudomonadota bacterium]|jgi:hypothetical protein
MSGRARQILGRFPAHLEAARPGKVLGEAVEALSLDLDTLSARMAAVRRAHRLADADEVADLLHLGALHSILPTELDVLTLRFTRAGQLLDELEKASGDAANTLAEELLDLWALQAPAPRLALFAPPAAPDAPPDTPPDLAAARQRLAAQGRKALRYRVLTAALRRRIQVICRQHAEGNGTVQALLNGAANALDLDIGPVQHSTDRFWHAAQAFDRLRVAELPVAPELIGIEENPIWRDHFDSTPRKHGELFFRIRRGFERALLQVQVTGLAHGRSCGPMLVNRDEGHGIGFAGTVPEGQTLTFNENGHTTLDGSDVTALTYAWQGGCFAGADVDARKDFVFDGPSRPAALRPATFVVTTPAGALDREASFPGSGEPIPMPGIAVGVTRLAFFVREAHAASDDGASATPRIRTVTPGSRAATFDDSVWAAGPADDLQPAAKVALSWLEHRAFAVRLLIPPRLRRISPADDGAEVLRRTAQAVERFRPVGIEVKVEFIDDRWVLGQGVLAGDTPADLVDQLRAGTTLWPSPATPDT